MFVNIPSKETHSTKPTAAGLIRGTPSSSLLSANMDFDAWLTGRLQELETDEAVFQPYIKSILEGDETVGEKEGDLEGLLTGLLDRRTLDSFKAEVFSRWEIHQQDAEELAVVPSLDSQVEKVLQLFPGSQEEKREVLLCPSDAVVAVKSKGFVAEESSDEDDEEVRRYFEQDVGRNTNAHAHRLAQRELLDRAKAEHLLKREKDREERARKKELFQENREKARRRATRAGRKR